MRSIVKDNFTFIRGDGNTRLIISSHGGYHGSTFRTPVNLHFMAHQNYCAKGQVTKVLAMSNKEFETETGGTSGINEHELTNFEHDSPGALLEVPQRGYDVVTIQKGKHVLLSTILTAPEINLFGYTDVYCLFCRVAMQVRYVKVM
jgi:hypothetical protein